MGTECRPTPEEGRALTRGVLSAEPLTRRLRRHPLPARRGEGGEKTRGEGGERTRGEGGRVRQAPLRFASR